MRETKQGRCAPSAPTVRRRQYKVDRKTIDSVTENDLGLA